ncbi:lipopolysaccharide biosynthesis protein [Aeromonas hydrophila]|uniref:lipopolysaccharide biosynthesis protein n=1 Tax=Aeromonas hydrophila TaxID=644 RepID=UPI00130333D4|nr:lipopolysaccharide biosynthesis protein [Aeromonas hydrophila]ELM3749669.1 lipopolysaccharide biosynthesis protein [Aeromonas dhakensis]QGZ72374.1 oligosaccharide flippase family protein [Aeromonas hydrophila]
MSHVKNGLKWSAIEKIVSQGVQFLTLLVLARLLTPNAFGVIAMTSIFISIAQLLIDGGFTSALIRKGKPSEIEYSTAFYFNIVVGFFIYIIIYFSAPLISFFYHEPILQDVLRVLGCVILVNSLTVVYRAKLNVALDFKSQSKVTVSSSLASGVIGVALAYHGYGVWALVAQSLFNAIISMCLYVYIFKWRPIKAFDVNEFKDMFGYGYKLILSSLIEVIYANSFIVIIGKLYSSSQVGLFYQAQRLIELPTSSFIGIIQRVNLPLMSKAHDATEINKIFSDSIILSTFIFTPLVCIVVVLSDAFFYYLLGPAWLAASKYLIILCGCYVFYPIHVFNLNLLQVKKRSDMFLKAEVIKKIIGVLTIICSFRFGVIGLCIGMMTSSILSLFVNCFYSEKVGGLTTIQQFKLTYKIYLSNSLALIVALFIASSFFHGNIIISSLIGLLLFCLSWLLCCCTFMKDEFITTRNKYIKAI